MASVTSTELGFVAGATSNLQQQINNIAGGGTYTQVEVDFGPVPLAQKIFTIVDGRSSLSKIVAGSIAYVPPTGKDLDELEMDAIDLKFGAYNGFISIVITGLEGYLHDKFKVNYLIGT
jgi:hypothetical protein